MALVRASLVRYLALAGIGWFQGESEAKGRLA